MTTTPKPRQRRGRRNAWKPQKRDLETIIQQKANGMTNALIARHFEICTNTLVKKAGDALARGKELHAGVLLSQMASLGRQSASPQTAFNATKWQLATLHGIGSETDGVTPNSDVDAAEERELQLEQARAKLAPYLAKSKQIASGNTIEGTATDNGDHQGKPLC